MTEQELQKQIDTIVQSVAAGEYSATDAEYLLKEIEKTHAALGTAKKEIVGRQVALALKMIAKTV